MPLRTQTIRPVLNRLAPAVTDVEALRRFRRDRDEEAFALLIKRFGPLVAGVCRRVLGSRPEADDAVQATFWTLARKARSIRHAKTLPAWLHAVAYRTARKALARLGPLPLNPPTPAAPDDPFADASWREVRQLLDEEVHRLPPRLRLPILLCYFEDLTRDEAADRLGWSLSTVKRRLDQARDRLKTRLVRRGVAPGLLGATALLGDRLSARVPPTLETACAGLAHQPPSATIRALAVAPPPGSVTWMVAAVTVVGLGWGIVTLAGQGPKPDAKPDPKAPPAETKEKEASRAETADPLPAGALARFGTVRYRASTGFWYASFSKDGRWMVSGTDGVELWDLETGVPRQLMPVRNNTVPRPRLSPDGSLVGVLDGGPGIHLFDRATGKELRTLGAKDSFGEWQFSPDNKRVVGIVGGLAKGFDVPTGAEVFSTAAAGSAIDAWNDKPVFFIVAGGKDGTLTVRVVDVETGKDLKTFETGITDYYRPKPPDPAAQFRTGIPLPDVMHYTVAPDLSLLAYQQADSTVAVVALTSGAKPRRVELTSGLRVSGLRFAPDGKTLIAFDHWDALARIDVTTGKLLGTYSGAHWHVDPAGKFLTTAGRDTRIRRWDLTTNREITLATGYYKAVHVIFTAAGRLIVGDLAGTIDMFDPRTGRMVQEVPRWRDGVDWYTFAVSRDGRTLVTNRNEGTMLWWDLAAGKELATTKAPGPVPDQYFRSIGGLVFTPDGRRLVCSHHDGRLFAIDTETRKEVWRVGLPTDRDWDVAVGLSVSADGRQVARGLRRGARTGDWGYGLQVLETATGRPLNMVDVSESKGKDGLPSLTGATYTPDGRFLVLVSLNGRIQVRHADTLAEVSSWMAGSKYAISLSVSPDSRFVLTGDDAGTAKVWELLTGKMVASFRGHRGTVASVAMSPDGKLLATGGHDQVAYTWSLKPANVPDRPLEALAGEDAQRAWEAAWALAADPDSPKRLRERFPPINEPKPETIQAWIADLDHSMFARREAAETALAKVGRLTEPAVRRALEGKPTAEARQRLEKVLAEISHRPTPEDIVHSRAVHTMELANTEAARKVLAEWAAGIDGAWLTADARAALERLRAR